VLSIVVQCDKCQKIDDIKVFMSHYNTVVIFLPCALPFILKRRKGQLDSCCLPRNLREDVMDKLKLTRRAGSAGRTGTPRAHVCSEAAQLGAEGLRS
jgi:hypothetical protein